MMPNPLYRLIGRKLANVCNRRGEVLLVFESGYGAALIRNPIRLTNLSGERDGRQGGFGEGLRGLIGCSIRDVVYERGKRIAFVFAEGVLSVERAGNGCTEREIVVYSGGVLGSGSRITFIRVGDTPVSSYPFDS
jgi:hypothetical protein